MYFHLSFTFDVWLNGQKTTWVINDEVSVKWFNYSTTESYMTFQEI